MTRIITEQLDPTFKDLSQNLLDDMAEIAGGYAQFGAGLYNIDPIDVALNFSKKTLINGYELGDMLHTNEADAVKRFKMMIAKGITEGKGYDAVAREIRRSGDKMISHISDVLVQGAMKTAVTQAMYESYDMLKGEGIAEGFEWVATLELNTCWICRELDGKQWKSTGQIPPMPAHFRCRCTIIPITEHGRSEKRAGKFYEVEGDELKASGKQFNNIDYKTWLGMQPKAVQAAVNSRKHISYDKFKKLLKMDAISGKGFKAAVKPKMPMFNSADVSSGTKEAFKTWSNSSGARAIRSHYYTGKIDVEQARYLGEHKGVVGTKRVTNAVDEMDNMFKNTAPDNIKEIHRGIQFDTASDKYSMKFSALNEGDTFRDKAPSSWSKSKDVADDFAGRLFKKSEGWESEGTSFVFHITPKKRMGYTMGEHGLGGEKEVIVKPNQRFKVIKKKRVIENNMLRVDLWLEELGDE